MSVQLSTIKRLQQKQTLVDLYRDNLNRESLTGVITDYSDAFVYLSLFSDVGLPNGIAIVYIADVTRIRWGGNERTSIEQLISAHHAMPLTPTLNLASLREAIESVQREFGYVNLLTERMNGEVTFIGEIEEIDDRTLVLHGYGTMSTRDRNHMLLNLEQISRIDAEAPYEKSIRMLFASPS